MSGMYPNDQTVLENGIWRLWSLEIDEPYFTMAGWKAGWSGVKPKPPGSPRPPLSPLVARMAPDILMTELGKRAEGFPHDTLRLPDAAERAGAISHGGVTAEPVIRTM